MQTGFKRLNLIHILLQYLMLLYYVIAFVLKLVQLFSSFEMQIIV